MAHRAAYDGADRRGGNAASDAIARLLMRYPNVGSATARGNGATDGGGASHSTLRAAYAAGRNNAHSAVTPRRELEETYQRQRLAESQVQQLSAELVRQRHLAATAQVQSKNAASINARLEEEMRRMRSTNEALVARAREANGFVSEWKRRYDELHHMNEMLKCVRPPPPRPQDPTPPLWWITHTTHRQPREQPATAGGASTKATGSTAP